MVKQRFYKRAVHELAPVALVFDQEEFNAAKKLLNIPESVVWLRDEAGAAVTSCEDRSGQKCYIVSLRNEGDGIAIAGRLVHEATHIKQQEMRRIGESEPSIEFEAYMMDEIFTGLAQEYKRKLGFS